MLYDRFIIRPLELSSAAYAPSGPIPGAHPVGYIVGKDGTASPATDYQAGGLGAEGGIVADARDEAAFLVGLAQGKLLPAAQLAALKTLPADVASNYALGVVRRADARAASRTSTTAAAPAFKTSVFVSDDGSRVAVLLLNGATADARGDTAAHAAAERLFCAA